MTQLTIQIRKTEQPEKQKTGVLVVPLFSAQRLPKHIKDIDQAHADVIGKTIKLGDFDGNLNTLAWLPGNQTNQRLLLVGCGARAEFGPASGYRLACSLATALTAGKASDALLVLDDLPLSDADATTFLEQLATELTTTRYQYRQTLTKSLAEPALRKVAIKPLATVSLAQQKKAIATGQHIGSGVNLTRELVNLPGNICTPTYLSQQARKLGRQHSKLKVSVLGEAKMRELGMGSLLSVGQGSDQPSQLIVMEYRGGPAKAQPYALVGKGITFDTGGISLKPGAKMDEMKVDMGGAGSVFGTLSAIAEMDLPINVVGVVAAAENMPSGRATKPGDVVTSLSGKTIEILNTDAEGRLVLCDALTYVARFKPVEVVDIATLTGAIIVSLGNVATGIFANDDSLAQALSDAGEQSKDRGWRLPLWDDYQKQLDSKFADIANIGTGGAGSITAACFLARFAEQYKWAHLDVAGTAFQGAPKGATGRPVPMLVQYLRSRAKGQ